ncbi:complement factor H isoform X2 [Xenopus laevis]|uniref:Complement factor H isoform X2 n=1 Tax=Xenopus laevis TaxID=8355 RepID=A0A8J0UYK7_XENLA|nr:complement factor H isoform X2 [Xenopus laevis]
MPEYLQVYIIALCCIAIGAQAPCDRPQRTAEEELQGTWDKDSYDHGTIASYICRPGYSRLGAIKKQCSNGIWTYLARGLCKKKSCGHPGDIPNGSFELKGETEFVFGAIVEYECDSGYQMLSKVSTRTCTANGWSNFLPNCEVKNCPPVELAEGVEIVSSYDDEYTVGKVMRFQCKNPKFKLDRTGEIFCTSEGDWSALAPKCEEIKCNVPELANGRINAPKEIYYLDDKLLYICDEKFKKDRSVDPACTKNGWSPEPVCHEITCQADYVANGFITNKKNAYKLGDIVEVECKRGYSLDKPNESRICTLNGWSLPLTCRDKICDRPDLQNGMFFSGDYFPARKNAILWYSCNGDFDPVYKESHSWYNRGKYGKSTCTENGWNPMPKCLALCRPSDAQVDNADIYDTKNQYKEGDRVRFKCYGDLRTEDGRNDGEIECLPNHKFSEARCLKSCTIESISHGNYIPKKSIFEYEESLVYACDEGYRSPTNTRFASATCPWTSPPRCVETTCYITELREEYKAGDVVAFSCSPGYKLIGQDVSQCYYYGWDPALPTCTDNYHRQAYPYELITKKQADFSMCATAPKPPYSQNLEAGNIPYNNDSIVEIQCNSNYRPFGSKSIKCQNGQWQSPPECVEKRYCNQPPGIKNGRIIKEKEWHSSGETVKYQCDPGYEISGSSESMCFMQQWTAPPVCKGKSCDKPPDVDNAVVIGLGTKQYTHGESAKYSCKPGYTISEDGQAKCVEGNWIYVPKCSWQGQICESPPVVQFGDTLENREPTNKHGTVMNYKCPEYYILEGSKSIVCRNGKWDDPPICIEPCTASERDMRANNIRLKWLSDKKLYTRHNEWIGFACLDGYEISDEKLLRIQCNRSVLPYPKCTKKGSCLLSLSTMDENNIFVNGSTEIERGKAVNFLCKEGWITKDTLTQVCNNQNIKYPTCRRAAPCEISSEDLDQNNLDFKLPDNPKKRFYAHKEEIMVMCKPGFHTSEKKPLKAECLEGQITFPKCTPGRNCTSLPKIPNGNVIIETQDDKSFSSGSTLKVECREGFAPVGPPVITCDNSDWTNAPKCAKLCQILPLQLETNNLQLESTNDLEGTFTNGNKLNVQCKPGYISTQNAPLKATCRGGNFSYPQCSPGSSCTISINVLEENKIELLRPNDTNKEYPHDTQFQFKCKSSYVLPPQKQLNTICDNGKLSFPRCYSANRCRISQEQMDENQLTLNSKDEDSVYFEDGELIQFKCNTGFTINSGITGLCAKTQITYPKCTEKRTRG